MLAAGAFSGLVGVAQVHAQSTYYVSSTGSDVADGKSPQTAWKSLDKVSSTQFAPGSQILFQRGDEWHGRLTASSDGSVAAPIVYGSYGSGAKPKFWGSDPVDNSSFTKLSGNVYSAPVTDTVNSLLANHEFLNAAFLKTGSEDYATNRTYVNTHPNSWTYSDGRVYANFGGANPTADGRLYTAAVRDDVVMTNGKDNLIFRDLVVDESAKDDAGYAFRVTQSDNVRIENSEAYRAGKHDIGVLDSNNFVGQGLYAAKSMPDQGYGGATAFVAYSNNTRSGDSSQWIDCTAEDLGAGYLGFYTHGEGIGDILVKNLVGRNGAGIGIATDSVQSQHVRIEGGHIDDGSVVLYGKGTVVDGLKVTGPHGMIDLVGTNNVIQNVLMTGIKPDHSEYAAVVDRGTNNVLQFNTIALDPTAIDAAAPLALMNPTSGLRSFGNIFQSRVLSVRQWFGGLGMWTSDYNLYSPGTQIALQLQALPMNFWRQFGFDVNTLLADPMFADALAGDYSLLANSPAANRVGYGNLANLPLWDFDGSDRPSGTGYDLGAFESVPEPATASVLMLVAGSAVLGRRRRNASR